jgi:hypothetical protein
MPIAKSYSHMSQQPFLIARLTVLDTVGLSLECSYWNLKPRPVLGFLFASRVNRDGVVDVISVGVWAS